MWKDAQDDLEDALLQAECKQPWERRHDYMEERIKDEMYAQFLDALPREEVPMGECTVIDPIEIDTVVDADCTVEAVEVKAVDSTDDSLKAAKLLSYDYLGVTEDKELCRGGFGTVYLGKFNDKKIAVKRMHAAVTSFTEI